MTAKDITADPIATLLPQSFQTIPWYHFSVDDVFDSLIEITLKDIPLFEHPFFALMKEMHDIYDVQVDLELFWGKEIDGVFYTLREMKDVSKEIKEQGSWLRFGPHAYNYMVAPFEQTREEQIEVFNNIYSEIDRFAGRQFYATWVRLHYYSESYELASYFKERGVTALFSTDREAGSHRMPPPIAQSLLQTGFATYEDAHFIRTQFRVEVLTNHRDSEEDLQKMFTDALEQFGYIIFYSHEYEFARSEVRNMFRTIFKVLTSLGVVSIKQSTPL